MSDAELERKKASLVKSLPLQSDIFLPTSKMPLIQQIEGLKRVKALFDHHLSGPYRTRLQRLKNGMKGRKRCFLIGNGPSLNDTDLSLLKDEITFAVNGFFLKSMELDWTPTFYVVEDHLVAEDRAQDLKEFKGPIKFYPSYLAYCIEPQDDTIFYNHRPRKSFPNGFDFSLRADEITYTGCTVIFSAMQLAAYLGFEEIYLLGVDASYKLPNDVNVSKEYDTSVLDMKTDDPNHFHPDYFGKGFRWHDPQVDKMVEAYKEALKVCEPNGIKIRNATIGGKLEVFPRVDYQGLFANEYQKRSPLPKLLLIDYTQFGRNTATGELKSKFFSSWDASNLLHLYAEGGDGFGLSPGGESSEERYDYISALEEIRIFGADIILYRPISDQGEFHELAMRVISGSNTPYLIWLMDDWPARDLKKNFLTNLDAPTDLHCLCQSANACLAISDAMAGAFGARYGSNFHVFHNGINPDNWRLEKSAVESSNYVTIRYSGALAPDMTLESIKDIARAVDRLSKGKNLRFEIRCQAHWLRLARETFRQYSCVKIDVADQSIRDYRQWLVDADILIICNNFDSDSQNYIKHSFANKIPEYLASGQSVFAYGPKNLASMDFLSKTPGVSYVGTQDIDAVTHTLRFLIENAEVRKERGARSQKYAFENLNFNQIKSRFEYMVQRNSSEVFKGINHAPAALPKRKRVQSPLMRSFKKYVLGWKGILGGTSSLLMAVGVFLSATHDSPILLLLALGLVILSQIILFFLIAHLSAHM